MSNTNLSSTNLSSYRDLRFIIVACDGLWKVFTAHEAATFVDAILQVGMIAAENLVRVTMLLIQT